MIFCPACQQQLEDTAKFCRHCGAPVAAPSPSTPAFQPQSSYPPAPVQQQYPVQTAPPGLPAQVPATGGKDFTTTLLLAIFLGGLGVHRFYTGHSLIGILQLLTCGGLGIWALVDIVLIATGSYKDANGYNLVK